MRISRASKSSVLPPTRLATGPNASAARRAWAPPARPRLRSRSPRTAAGGSMSKGLPNPELEERARRVREHAKAGRTKMEVCDIEGIDPKNAVSDLKGTGLSFADHHNGYVPMGLDEIAAMS